MNVLSMCKCSCLSTHTTQTSIPYFLGLTVFSTAIYSLKITKMEYEYNKFINSFSTEHSTGLKFKSSSKSKHLLDFITVLTQIHHIFLWPQQEKIVSTDANRPTACSLLFGVFFNAIKAAFILEVQHKSPKDIKYLEKGCDLRYLTLFLASVK